MGSLGGLSKSVGSLLGTWGDMIIVELCIALGCEDKNSNSLSYGY